MATGGAKRAHEDDADTAAAAGEPAPKKARTTPPPDLALDRVWWFVCGTGELEGRPTYDVTEWDPRSAKDPAATAALILKVFARGQEMDAAAMAAYYKVSAGGTYFWDALHWLETGDDRGFEIPSELRDIQHEDVGKFHCIGHFEPLAQWHDGRTLFYDKD
jgi:hypothetical protein